ncbi:hypothetical protein AAN93_005130 [Salmonella enterica subsp. enterica]|uniref:Uncharacterized protein n=1 Tax=Salmonella enterica TaxID=28901 RepID=A0A7D8IYP0_SALER|nr:hypothetical protein [Salmonella enterica]EDR2901319.1 hypothetical protein [Salmonella enterica subsp. enterica serovar Amherstiana]EIK6737796.1 hypothetical protein [Salmonella enterica subsp. enterica serovar Aqua]MCH5483203.1 hypothetical protein [Salmonella enterica subsp. diarizonae serovar 16:z10:e,n,x,z15]WGI49192.1 hypothetical protein QBX66_22050 [Salmonella enterica subsp. diarizonae serovar 48:i:z]ELU0512727.1 hypothetical protein [Salmonella enterica]
MLNSTTVSTGMLAAEYAGLSLPLQVLPSGKGFYIGTENEMGPVSRESVEYFTTAERAERALEKGTWSQRQQP